MQGGGRTDGTGEKYWTSGRKRWKVIVGVVGRSTTNTIVCKYYSTVSYFLVLWIRILMLVWYLIGITCAILKPLRWILGAQKFYQDIPRCVFFITYPPWDFILPPGVLLRNFFSIFLITAFPSFLPFSSFGIYICHFWVSWTISSTWSSRPIMIVFFPLFSNYVSGAYYVQDSILGIRCCHRLAVYISQNFPVLMMLTF